MSSRVGATDLVTCPCPDLALTALSSEDEGSIAVVVVLAVGCEKKVPRYEGPMRVDFGDCAIDASWSSGPRPTPPSVKKSEPLPPAERPPVAVADPKASKDTPEDPALARQQAIQQARDAGILGQTQLVEGGAFASLTGTGDISGGFDDSDIYGGLLGNGSGGGTGWGTIGTGRYGTIGRGSGMRGRTATVPTIGIGQPTANGDLDKVIIRRYIKRNIQKLQYCYEKQLLAKPALAGTVNAQFFIDPNGSVASSSASGVDPEVSGCVAAVIKSIEFPKPKGGGGVQVNYPFTFRPADAPTPPPPSVASTGVSNTNLGAFTADEVNRVVKSRLGVFRACYQKELIRTPGIGGTLVVKFKIAADGSVASAAATAGSTLSNVAVLRDRARGRRTREAREDLARAKGIGVLRR